MDLVRMALLFTLIIGMTGCAGMTPTQQRVLSGSALGTAAGVGTAAIVGGSLVTGAVVGAAAGAVGGIIVDGMERSR